MTFQENKYAIITAVTPRDAIRMYCPELQERHHRIPCPFHHGHDDNFEIYEDGWHCFVCDMGGSTIDFVRYLFNISYKEAMEKINDDFNLGLEFGRHNTLAQQRAFREKYEAFVEARIAEERRAEAVNEEYWNLNQAWILADALLTYQPLTGEERSVVMAQEEYLRYQLDTFDFNRKEVNEDGHKGAKRTLRQIRSERGF